MNSEDTKTQRLAHKALTSVRSGAVCRLVGVGEEGWGYKGSPRFFGKWGGGHSRRGGRHWGKRGSSSRMAQRSQREITRRLLDLGLTKGCTFKVVQGSRFGPVLVEVRGTRIALGHGLARKLIVEEVAESC